MTAFVAALYQYPVKGLRGHAVPVTDVEACGLAGDRRWMIVDENARFLTQRQYPRMATIEAHPHAMGLVLATAGLPALLVPFPPADARSEVVTVWRDTVTASRADRTADEWLTQALGVACRLVYLADPKARAVDPEYGETGDRVSFADGFPVLLTASGSLDDLNTRLRSAVPMQRFRPNLVIGGTPPWAEDTWRRIRIGTVVFRVAKPCVRCLVTSVDQQTGVRPEPHEPLHTLGTFRRGPQGVTFGQNAIPDTLGRVAVGDRVSLLDLAIPDAVAASVMRR